MANVVFQLKHLRPRRCIRLTLSRLHTLAPDLIAQDELDVLLPDVVVQTQSDWVMRELHPQHLERRGKKVHPVAELLSSHR